MANNLWIGLHDREQFEDSSDTCTCSSVQPNVCEVCRDRFVWVDETPINKDFAPWSESEPGSGEKCVRLTDNNTNNQWAAAPCSTKIDYVCARGKNHSLRNLLKDSF